MFLFALLGGALIGSGPATFDDKHLLTPPEIVPSPIEVACGFIASSGSFVLCGVEATDDRWRIAIVGRESGTLEVEQRLVADGGLRICGAYEDRGSGDFVVFGTTSGTKLTIGDAEEGTSGNSAWWAENARPFVVWLKRDDLTLVDQRIPAAIDGWVSDGMPGRDGECVLVVHGRTPIVLVVRRDQEIVREISGVNIKSSMTSCGVLQGDVLWIAGNRFGRNEGSASTEESASLVLGPLGGVTDGFLASCDLRKEVPTLELHAVFGGSGTEWITDIACAEHEICVCGGTTSSEFAEPVPITRSGHENLCHDGFVAWIPIGDDVRPTSIVRRFGGAGDDSCVTLSALRNHWICTLVAKTTGPTPWRVDGLSGIEDYVYALEITRDLQEPIAVVKLWEAFHPRGPIGPVALGSTSASIAFGGPIATQPESGIVGFEERLATLRIGP